MKSIVYPRLENAQFCFHIKSEYRALVQSNRQKEKVTQFIYPIFSFFEGGGV